MTLLRLPLEHIKAPSICTTKTKLTKLVNHLNEPMTRMSMSSQQAHQKQYKNILNTKTTQQQTNPKNANYMQSKSMSMCTRKTQNYP